jgi:hypothetical protein
MARRVGATRDDVPDLVQDVFEVLLLKPGLQPAADSERATLPAATPPAIWQKWPATPARGRRPTKSNRRASCCSFSFLVPRLLDDVCRQSKS